MFYSKVEICGVNTAKLPTLTDKEKTELLLKGQRPAMRRRASG